MVSPRTNRGSRFVEAHNSRASLCEILLLVIDAQGWHQSQKGIKSGFFPCLPCEVLLAINTKKGANMCCLALGRRPICFFVFCFGLSIRCLPRDGCRWSQRTSEGVSGPHSNSLLDTLPTRKSFLFLWLPMKTSQPQVGFPLSMVNGQTGHF